MNLETKITIYKFTPQLFTLTPLELDFVLFCLYLGAKCIIFILDRHLGYELNITLGF